MNSRPDEAVRSAPSPASAPFIPYGRQHIDDADVQAVVEVLGSKYLTTGPAVDAFEEDFAEATGSAHAVSVANGTVALHALYAALGLGHGDEIVVPAITFVATANAAVYLGATPVFADVDPSTALMDAESVRERIGPRTRAVVSVDFAGQPCDYDALTRVCDEAGVVLVADACHALGGAWKGRPVGSLTYASTFSLHPVKHITSAEGGMITTDDAEFAAHLKVLRNHGIRSTFRERAEGNTWEYDMSELGFNYRLSDVHAALGRSQLRKLPEFVERRRQVAARYREAFAGHPDVVPLDEAPGATGSYHLFMVRIPAQRKAEVFEAMRGANIGVNVHYQPVYLHSYYRREFGFSEGLCPVAEEAYEELLTLPMYPQMTDEDVDRVAGTLIRTLDAG